MRVGRLLGHLLNSSALWNVDGLMAPDGAGSSGGPAFRRARLVALEPRVLFDAALADTMDSIPDHEAAADAEPMAHEHDGLVAALLAPAPDAARGGVEVAFVDLSVEDAEAIIAAFGPDVEIHFITSESDGIEQMAQVLSGRSNISAIHVVSHGEAGVLSLGSAALTAESIGGKHADELAVMAAALSDSADMVIYGCNFAAGEAGAAAVQALANATGADVAASDDITGAAALGGDWVLEMASGRIETQTVVAGSYGHVLWDTQGFGAGWFGDSPPNTPNATLGAGSGLASIGAMAAGPGLSLANTSVSGSSVFQVGAVAATTFAQAQTNGEYITTGFVVGSEAVRISQFTYNQKSENAATARMAIAILDVAANVLIPVAQDILIDGTAAGVNVPLTAMPALEENGSYEIRLYFYGSAANMYIDNPVFNTQINSDPVANADFLSVPVGTATVIHVTENDTDTDIDNLVITEINGSSIALGATVSLASGTTVTLQHDGSLSVVKATAAAESFSYTVIDHQGHTASATATLTASATNSNDIDADGVANATDIDDDNDGILDVTEGLNTVATTGTWSISGNTATSTLSNGIVVTITKTSVNAFSNGNFNPLGTGFWSPELANAPSLVGNFEWNSQFTVAFRDSLGNPVTVVDPILHLDRLGGSDGAIANSGRFTLQGGLTWSKLDGTEDFAATSTTTNDFGASRPIGVGFSTESTLTDNTGTASGTLRINGPVSSFTISNVQLGPFGAGSDGIEMIVQAAVAPVDTDGDGRYDFQDIDSDNDGITDNLEAQATAAYVAPSGTGAGMTDANSDGLDDVYDAGALGSAGGIGLTPVNTDAAGTPGVSYTPDATPDYRDSDSDGDGVTDLDENGLGVTSPAAADTDHDGLLDAFEAILDSAINDGFKVSEGVTNPLSAATTYFGYLPDSGGDATPTPTPMTADLDYRDALTDYMPPYLDADQNDSAGVPGTDYETTFTENGPAVPVVDGDVFAWSQGALQSATITLTNAVAGDTLAVGSPPAGITAVVDTGVPGVITVTLSGSASMGDYQTALQAIGFSTPLDMPDSTDRVVTMKVNDGVGDSSIATTTIHVVPVNDPPAAVNDGPVPVIPGVATNIAVLGNDSDPEGNPISVSQINGITIAVGGTVTLASGTVVTRNADGTLGVVMASGHADTETFTYQVSDGNGGTSTASVTLARDTDSDGVANTTDIDDDNDGILDTVENGAVTPSDLNLPATNTGQANASVTGIMPNGGAFTMTRIDPVTGAPVNFRTVSTGQLIYTGDSSTNFPAGGTIPPVTAGAFEMLKFDTRDSASTAPGAPYVMEISFATPQYNPVINISGTSNRIITTDVSSTLNPGGTFYLTDANGADTLPAAVTAITNGVQITGNHTQDAATVSLTVQGLVSTVRITMTEYQNTSGLTTIGGASTAGAQDNAGIFISGGAHAADTDGDGIANALDIDSDNDGITDNVEAQTTAGYMAPSGVGSGTTDANNDGLDDVYDSGAPGSGGGIGLTPVNSDGADTADYIDTDSDNDGALDVAERGTPGPALIPAINAADTDGDGLKDVFEGSSASDGFDVNDENLTGATFNLADTDNDTAANGAGAVPLLQDLDFRDVPQPPVLDLDGNDSTNSTGAGTGVNYEATYSENTPAIHIADTDFVLTDPDHDIASLTVILADGQIGDTFILPPVLPGGIVASVVPAAVLAAPGTLSIVFTGTGSTTTADWQTLLDSIRLLPSATDADSPHPADRHITVQAADAGALATALATATIHVAPVNDPPTLDLDDDDSTGAAPGDASLFYGENDPPVALHSGIALTDLDDTNLESATVTHTNPQAGDQLYVNGVAVNPGDSGTVGGLAYVVSLNGSSQPVISFTGSAPLATYDAALQSVGFASVSENPSAAVRDFAFVVNDGSQDSPVRHALVTVTAVNDAPDARNDEETTDEHVSFSDSVLPDNGNGPDSDADSSPLVVTQVNGAAFASGGTLTLPSGALLTISSDGTYTYDPNGQFNGLGVGDTTTDSFTYQLSDGSLTDTATVTITITGVNDAPVAQDDAETTGEDSIFSDNVLANNGSGSDTDPDSDPLTVSQVNGAAFTSGSAITLPSGALLTMNSDGSYSYDPNGAFDGLGTGESTTDSFTYQISDGNGGFDTATVMVTINGVNDTPVLVTPTPDQTGVDNQSGISIDAAAAFDDPDSNDTLTYSATGLPLGLSIHPATGLITGTIDNSASQNGNTGLPTDGVYTIVVTADDGNGGVITDTFTYTVTNPAPVAQDDLFTTTEGAAPLTSGSVLANNGNGVDADPDGDSLVVSEVDGAGGNVSVAVIGTNGGLFTITAAGGFSFADDGDFEDLAVGETRDTTISYQISDGEGGFDTATVTVRVTGSNDAPTVTAPLADVTGADADVVAGLDASVAFDDTDLSDTLSFSATGLPLGLVINPVTGVISGTIDPSASQNGNTGTPDAGVYTVVVTADDGHGGVVTDTFTYTVSNPPPVAQDDDLSGNEDTPVTGLDVLASNGNGADTDPDGDTLFVDEVNGSNGNVGVAVAGSSGGLFTLASDGTLAFDPNGDFDDLAVGESRDTTITYQVSDNEGGVSTATVTYTVNGANDAPVPLDPANPGVPPADPSAYIPQQPGTDSAPATALDVTQFASDPDASDTLTFTINPADLPPGLTFDGTTISGTYAADASQGGPGGDGVYPVTLTVSDGHGGSFTTTIVFDVSNPSPVAQDDDVTTTEDVVGSGSVFADNGNGADSDPDNDSFTVTAVGGLAGNVGVAVAGSGGGTFTIVSDGGYSFDPGTDFNGLDVGETAVSTISYTITDADGASSTALVTVVITGVNDAPVVVDPLNPGTQDNPNPADPDTIVPLQTADDGEVFTLASPLVGLSPYMVDPDGEPLSFSTSSSLPAGLTLNPDGTVTGTIGRNASQGGDDPIGNPGVYTITVDVTDGDATTQLTLTIDVSNLVPVAQDDAASIGEDAPNVTGNVITDLLTGDADTAPDSDPLTVTLANQAGNPIAIGTPFTASGGGVLTLNSDGSYSFEPGTAYNRLDVGETATETITYTVDDGNGGTDTAFLVITVQGANDTPVVIDPTNPGTPSNPNPAPDPLNIIPDVTTTDGAVPAPVNVGSYIVDPDGEPLVFTATGLPPGMSIDPDTGIISGTLPADASQAGPYTVTVTATDPDGAAIQTTVTYTVINLPPVAVDDVSSGDEDTAQAGNVLTDPATGDSDALPDSDPLVVSQVNGSPVSGASPVTIPLTHGTLVMAADGAWTFVPNAFANGLAAGETASESVSYTISDGNGGTDTARLDITLTGVNDAPVVSAPVPDQSTDEGATVTVPTGPHFSDVDRSDDLTFTATGLPPGLAIDPATGVITGTVALGSSAGGPYTVTVTADDGHGGTVVVTFEWEVILPATAMEQANEPPAPLPLRAGGIKTWGTPVVGAAANGLGDLDGTPTLGEHAVLSAATGVGSLNSAVDLGDVGNVITRLVDWARRQGRAASWMHGVLDGLALHPYTGDSIALALSIADENALTLKTLIKDGAMFIGIDRVGAVSAIHISGPDGGPLPDHVALIDAQALVVNIRPDMQPLSIVVSARSGSGQVHSWPVTVDPLSAEVTPAGASAGGIAAVIETMRARLAEAGGDPGATARIAMAAE